MINISIVIPTLNEEDNLPTCLENIVPQLEEGDEIIIVDGGSTDDTVKIAHEYGAIVYINEGDSSIGLDRDIGVRKSSNPVIATLDADSIPPSGWLDRVRWNFEDDPELALVWGSIEDENGVPIRNLVGKFSTVLRGASGNNTAFRKEYFEKTDGYPDISFMEDFLIINRISEQGKVRRDKNMVMVMNMDRRRYQTIPIVSIGAGSLLLSQYPDNDVVTDVLKGFGLGIAGTELFYEAFSGHGTDIHHDHVGLGTIFIGRYGEKNNTVAGIGAGMFAHHALTEGVSMMPTKLQENTQEIIEV
jgi:glycosyltransferase involved in cell wall biosynthesis